MAEDDGVVRFAKKLSKLRRSPAAFFRDFFAKRTGEPPPTSPPPKTATPKPPALSDGPASDTVPQRWPPGHYYSPIVAPAELEERRREIWPRPPPRELAGIDLRIDHQLGWIEEARRHRDGFPDYPERPCEEVRYHTKNGMFGLGDALALYTVMCVNRPAHIVEVGSGFSSAVMLDVNERVLDRSTRLTFVEPYPDRLHSLLRIDDYDQVEIHEARLQEAVLPLARELDAGDILFVDSSHVSKTGSDVNYLLFEVLPALKRGVFVHFHDITYPFQYIRRWVAEGRNWNEAYLLRAFLMYNPTFEIEWFISCLKALRKEKLHDVPGGSYLWLRKT